MNFVPANFNGCEVVFLRKKAFDEEVVLRSVMLLFWEKGYDSTSIGDLEKESGLIRTSLYHFYGNKEKIFLAALDLYIREQCSGWVEILNKQSSVISILNEFFDSIIAHNCNSETPTGCMIAVNSTVTNGLSYETKEKLQLGYKTVISALESLFERSIEQKYIKSNDAISAHDLAIYVMGCIQGIMVLSRALNNEIDLRAIKRQAIRHVESYVLKC